MWRRRRTALNEALHELRRPLQALALAGAEPGAAARFEDSVRLAASALERLDEEINGCAAPRAPEPVCLASLLGAAVERWRPRAELAGGTLVLRAEPAEAGPPPRAVGDRWAIAQALENLIVNAIEHGGPRVVVSVRVVGAWVRVSVRDCARPLAPAASARARRSGLRDRVLGGSRRGHGLRIVRRIAAAHGGTFALSRSPGGAEAVLELPVR